MKAVAVLETSHLGECGAVLEQHRLALHNQENVRAPKKMFKCMVSRD
jgi:hypothetical protein